MKHSSFEPVGEKFRTLCGKIVNLASITIGYHPTCKLCQEWQERGGSAWGA